MKKLLKQERGVSLISLSVAIIIIGIITTMLLYSITDTNDIDKLTKLYTDIDNLSDKISNYYTVHGKIPAKPISVLSGANAVMTGNQSVGENDTGDFLVIDLKAIDNLTLNYGKDFEQFKDLATTGNSIGDKRDLYVINENSHNIFYLNGITLKDGKTYYTNLDKDTEKVDLRYVDGIKIYDGYNYVSGNKQSGIIIGLKGSETVTSTQYTWINVENKIQSISDLTGITVVLDNNTQTESEFVESVNGYKGFYKNSSNNVLYLNVDGANAWSAQYDEEGTYRDKNGDTAYIPKGFRVSRLESMNTIKTGLVIKNDSNQKFVWIGVSKEAMQDAQGRIAGTLEELENDLFRYTNSYRVEGYMDTYYEGCIGATKKNEYNGMKNKMYQSIKDKGGFWVGLNKMTENKNCYDAYTQVYSEANGRTKSLMFGIQWDLMCMFLEENDITILNDLGANGNGELTLESISENSETSATAGSGNKTVIRGKTATESRNQIPYNQASYFRTTIF